jgi:hypothetical protein
MGWRQAFACPKWEVAMVDTLEQEEALIESSDRQLDLFEHLTELRTRLARCVAYVGIGMIAGWIFYAFFFELLSAPVMQYLRQNESSFLLTGVAEAFTIKMQISLLVGVILALPLITMEGWRFVAPGETGSATGSSALHTALRIGCRAGLLCPADGHQVAHQPESS